MVSGAGFQDLCFEFAPSIGFEPSPSDREDHLEAVEASMAEEGLGGLAAEGTHLILDENRIKEVNGEVRSGAAQGSYWWRVSPRDVPP